VLRAEVARLAELVDGVRGTLWSTKPA
jgi:hypothetical protein